MSPFLFLLIVEGLSRLINKEKQDGSIDGINFAWILSTTHLLFVDDAILFGRGTIEEWSTYKNILQFFSNAIGMDISDNKPIFL